MRVVRLPLRPEDGSEADFQGPKAVPDMLRGLSRRRTTIVSLRVVTVVSDGPGTSDLVGQGAHCGPGSSCSVGRRYPKRNPIQPHWRPLYLYEVESPDI